ncbi:transmembrane protein 168-like [Littorina saxatilis]|uniref:Transmembrane protein 168 n=1 Tax=Littorina saxatilis TaxID=31220 RepID=A0AAN9GBI4_9CAEN
MVLGLSKVRYFIVHLPALTMSHVKDLRAQLTLQNVQYVPEVVLLVALGLGLYTQWSITQDPILSFISITAMFIFAVSCALRYYCNMQRAGGAVFHIWVGCLIGILAYSDSSAVEYVTTQEAMEALFLTSLVLGVFWHVLSRLLKLADPDPGILGMAAALEGLGLVIGGMVTGNSAWVLGLMTLAFLTHVAALRLKSTFVLISLAAFIIISILSIFPSLSLKPNVYALVCIAGRHTLPAALDLYLSSRSTLERWHSVFFTLPRIVRYMSLVGILGLDTVLGVVVGRSTMQHKEWFVVFPLFLAVATIWLLLHLAYLGACWQLMGKVSQCNSAHSSLGEPSHSYPRIMAARGLRHFGLVTQRLICLSLTSTLALLALGWETRTPYSLTLIFTILPLEAATLSLFWELGDSLGGTCTAYAMISPVTNLRPEDSATLLPSSVVQEMTSRAMAALAQVQHFFAFHMLANYGCDLSTSGLNIDSVHSKLNAFFEQRTNEGPRYDTYLLYYCGDVFENGDWAFSDNKRLTLDTLLEWWETKNGASGARLILILDSMHSYVWAQDAKRVRDIFFSVQSCRYIRRPVAVPELEGGSGLVSVGAFTRAYMQYNTGQEVSVDWTGKQRPLRAIYSVSRGWTDFVFHLPTRDDYQQYWDSNFPRFTRPLLKALNIPGISSLFCCCTCFWRWLRRVQFACLPPREVDTGHGFKLVKS